MRTLLMLLAVAAASVAAVPARAASPSLAEMAGQMIIVGFKGDNVSDASIQALRQEIAKGQIGGVMYLKPNVKSLAAVKAMNLAFKAAHPDLPPFITLDQEGGKVQRLTAAVGFPEMPSAADVARGTPEAAATTYAKTAAGLADLGFNVNFGPVVDLNVNPNNPIIGKYGRSFGTDPAAVTQYAEAFIAAHHEAGILTALKHFPGHGSSTTDSHKGFVDVSATWKPVELAPYKNLISDTQLDFVMVGHLLDNAYGPAKSADPMPSSLSPAWIGKVLRTDLGFKGVVISDDLEMGAIRDLFKPASNAEIVRQTVIQAVNAGINVLLFSNTAAYDAKLGEEIQQVLVNEGTKDPAFARKIEASYQLIVALKSTLKPA